MKRRALPVLVVLTALLVGAGVGGYLFFLGGGKPAEGQARESAGVPVKIGELTTNLADPGGRRLIQVEVEIEVRDARAAKRLSARMTGLRDAVLQVLRARTFEQVTAPGAMEALKKDIKERIDRFAGAPEVQDVFFGRFIVQ